MTIRRSTRRSKESPQMLLSSALLLVFLLGIDTVSSFASPHCGTSTAFSFTTSDCSLGGALRTLTPRGPSRNKHSLFYSNNLNHDRRPHGALRQSLMHESAANSPSSKSTKASSSTPSSSSASATAAAINLNVVGTSISATCKSLSQSVKDRYRTTSTAAWSLLLSACASFSSLKFTRVLQACRNVWWTMPLVLCLVPVYSYLVLQTVAVSPECWKMVEMQYIRDSPDAALVIGFFLLSNVCYFLSGLYMLFWRRILLHSSPVPTGATTALLGKSNNSKTGPRSMLSWPLALLMTFILKTALPSSSDSVTLDKTSSPSSSTLSLSKGLSTARLLQKPRTGLAFWILASGLVSTIFHSVQAMGATAETLALAEACCYVDHGVAGTAVLYFWRECGRPRGKVLAMSAAGLLALALPLRPGYAWLHSLWHFLSALTAIMWSFQTRIPSTQQQEQQQAAAAVLVDNFTITNTKV